MRADSCEMEGGAIETRGAARALLRLLRYYWVNSGIAVFLMLLLGWGNGYKRLWPVFGSANQLLAALTLVVATSWLIARSRPIWYTLLPAVFMTVTSLWMLVYTLKEKFLPDWPETAPLTIMACVVLAMTVGILSAAILRWARRDVPADG